MVTVRDILEKKGGTNNFVNANALVFDALSMLDSVNLSYLIVKDGEEFSGIFCERDYCRNVVLKGRSSKDTPVKDVMTLDLPSVSVSDTAEYCMNAMNQHKTRYLLAYDEEEFKGVITIHDLLRQVLANKQAVFDSSLAGMLLDHDEGGKVY